MTTATFNDGTKVTNASSRPALVAWRLVYPSGAIKAGNGTGQKFAFSKDRATAEKSAKATSAMFRGKFSTFEKLNGGAPVVEIVNID